MPNCITRLLEDDADRLKYALTFCFNSLYQYQSNRRTFRVESSRVASGVKCLELSSWDMEVCHVCSCEDPEVH